MSTISVVIPAYNAERTILETVKSVQEQTFQDFELIIINDGSNDRTLNLLDIVEDSRLKVFSYKNGGLSVARNRGISRATGDYIAFLDADDLWTPDKLELQLQALQQNPKAGLAYSWTYFMDEQKQTVHLDRPLYFEGNVHADLLVWNFLAHGSNPLIRKEVIDSVGNFNPDVSGAADWDYWLRIAERWEFAAVHKPQIFYRLSSTSMSSKVEFMEQCQLDVLEQAFERADNKLKSLKKKSKANVYIYSAQLYITRAANSDGIRKTFEKLYMAACLNLSVLLERKTQKIIFKLILLFVLPPKYAQFVLEQISKARAVSTEQLNEISSAS
jgi:glycosyltransferase involved in cell wall biosynthesis